MMRSFREGNSIKPDQFDPDQPIEVSEEFFRDVLDAFRPSMQDAANSLLVS